MIRVKLYVLNENRQWDDKGKGYVSVVARQKNSTNEILSSSSSAITNSSSAGDPINESVDDFFKNQEPDLNNGNDPEDEELQPEDDENTESSKKQESSSSKEEASAEETEDGSSVKQNSDVGTDRDSASDDSGSSAPKRSKGVNAVCSKKEMMIVMKSEADPSVTLLCSKIQADTLYQKQQDTLIVWNSETEGDLALSFEEIKGQQFFRNLSCQCETHFFWVLDFNGRFFIGIVKTFQTQFESILSQHSHEDGATRKAQNV